MSAPLFSLVSPSRLLLCSVSVLALGSTALAEFDSFLEWAAKNIDNPLLQSGCAVSANKQ